MLRVKTKVGISGLHGLGLFADEFIPKGTVTWQYDSQYDPSFTKEEVEALPAAAQQFMHYYCYFDFDLDKYILCSDNQRYINHSLKRRNIHSTPNQDVAARDIQPGEEFFCDYHEFDAEYFGRHGIVPTDFDD